MCIIKLRYKGKMHKLKELKQYTAMLSICSKYGKVEYKNTYRSTFAYYNIRKDIIVKNIFYINI